MERCAKAAFGLLCVATLVGTLLYPTYPNYDSYYSLLWAREVLDGTMPVFEGFRFPTEHPLAILVSLVLVPFGAGADRLWIILVFAAFLALVAGIYRLGRVAFTPLVGIVAALLVLSRFDFGFLAARGYVDVPFLALVVWAVAMEAARPRRGVPVLVLLVLASLLRPEGWLLLGLYWLWLFPGASWRQRAIWAAIAAIGPLGWLITDGIVTGDPLFSLTYTSDSAEDLGRSKTLAEIPSAIPEFLADLTKAPVLIAGVLGLLAAVLLVPRRVLWPLVLLLSGILTFLAIGVAGLSVIERYLVSAALGVLVFAAFFVAGWTVLEPGGRLRRVWMALAGAGVVFVLVVTAINLDLNRFDNELSFRGEAHDSLTQVLGDPAVERTLRCGPLTLPNHKLVPDARWIADLPSTKVWARVQRPNQRAGVAIVVLGRFAIFKQAWTNELDRSLVQRAPEGFRLLARTRDYAAYGRCA